MLQAPQYLTLNAKNMPPFFQDFSGHMVKFKGFLMLEKGFKNSGVFRMFKDGMNPGFDDILSKMERLLFCIIFTSMYITIAYY